MPKGNQKTNGSKTLSNAKRLTRTLSSQSISPQPIASDPNELSGQNRGGGSTRKWWFAAVVGVIACSACWGVWLDRSEKLPLGTTAHYVGRQSCAACHQQQHESFLTSHHHHALAAANAQTVLGNFDNQTLEHDGITSRFFRRGDQFLVTTQGPDGALAEFQVRFVLAYHPLQQYMVSLTNETRETRGSLAENGRSSTGDLIDPLANPGLGALQVLRLCWDVENKQWYYLRPEDVSEKLEPGDPLHWTGVTQRWNTSCAACHSTNLKRNFEANSGQFQTTFSEVDVSCESCHGPASLHVAIAEKKWFSWDPNFGTGLVSLAQGDAKQQIDTCAGCHSRRRQISDDFHETKHLHDHIVYEPMRADTYFVDGQIKDEDYVYGSFIQSKMHSKGIRCTDCHDPHSGKTYYQDNQLCTSCHAHPSGVYDSVEHHGHKMMGAGSQCVDCHMPHRYYMDIDARRDHSIRIPRPDLSVSLGVPNACTGCHLRKDNIPAEIQPQLVHYQDWQTLAAAGHLQVAGEIQRVDQWAAEVVEKWRLARGKPQPEVHFGEILHAVRQGDAGLSNVGPSGLGPSNKGPSSLADDSARQQLLKVANDVSASPMYRVTAVSEIASWRDGKSLQTTIDLMQDADAEVVFFAAQRIDNELARYFEFLSYGAAAQSLQPQIVELAKKIAPLLDHDRRLVRIQAASVLVNLPPEIQNEALSGRTQSLEAGIKEAIEVHLLNEEMAAIAQMYQVMGDLRRAKEYYQLEIKHQPNQYGARTNLAVILEREIEEEVQRFQQGAARTAQDLQQAMATMRLRLDEKAKEAIGLREQDFQLLKKEIERSGELASAADIHYRYAMALYLRDDNEGTERHLQIANAKSPNTAAYLLALATYYKSQSQWPKVLQLCSQLLKLDSVHPGYQALLQEARRASE